ncbi:hypothetical protein AGMMS50276_27610 [Synergistales bacterium]|nr:hypothetical protein AGMMS50276_27610 [Synergistales bacterium]
MNIKSFPIKMDEGTAREMSEGGNFITKLLFRKKTPVELRRVFIENRIMTFTITYHPSIIARIFRKNQTPKTSKIVMIGNGSTCGVSYYDGRELEIIDMEVDPEEVQASDFSDEALITRGNALARRILRRRVGGNISLDVAEIKSVYRPYYVAFYGTLVEGTKVRYMPIPADGNVVKRTF